MSLTVLEFALLAWSIAALSLAIPRLVRLIQRWRADKRDYERLKREVLDHINAADKRLCEAAELRDAVAWGAARGLVPSGNVRPAFQAYDSCLRSLRIATDRFRLITQHPRAWTEEELSNGAGEASIEEQKTTDIAKQRYGDKELRERVLKYLGEFKTPKEEQYLVLLGFKDEPQEEREKQPGIVQK